MAMIIDIQDETEKLTTQQYELIENVIRKAADMENVKGKAELSITIVSKESIRLINKDYRGKDSITDVVSFALNDGEDQHFIDGMPNLLGDIIISYPVAEEQALEYNHSLERELSFLAVHGFLHLLGYTHDTEKEEKTMFERQETILKSYGIQR
ncbi:rRNA maturation RNase YbeY [Alteribacillus sp. HJP-4]|uniref:rRNA maturation RNase YbeY n=1 Tax=Alteribacillus sp. HJP-4 TaxID=2775394 RepID=UPI0035CD29B7